MSHTLHRFGPEATFNNDFPIISRPAMKFNHEGAAPKMRRTMEIIIENNAINWGNLSSKQNMALGYKSEDMLSKIEDNSPVNACFDDRSNVVNTLINIKEAGLGISVVITGLRDVVEDICREAGVKPHSADLSLGVFGATEKLAEDETLCFTTMCGHAMISAGLVKQIRKAVKEGRMSSEEGANILAKPCYCGVFNISRAKELLETEKNQED